MKINKKNFILLTWTLFLVLEIMACSYGPKQVNTVYSQVVGLNSDLMQFTKIDNVRARYLNSGVLEASIIVTNLSAEDLSVRVKFKFMDADGFPLEQTNWAPYLLVRGEDTLIKSNSISAAAKDFKVLLDWQ